MTSAQAPTAPVRIAGGVMAAMLEKKVQPVYFDGSPAQRPDGDAQLRVTGTVLLHAIVGRDGRVKALYVVSGPKRLQAPALDAVRQWQYKPYRLNGQAVEVDTTVAVNF